MSRPWENQPRKVTSQGHPNPHTYEVRLIQKGHQSCSCRLATPYDPTTGKAEMLCRCDPPGGMRAEYVGHFQDANPFTMRLDSQQPGSQPPRPKSKSRRLRKLAPELKPVF